MGWVPLNGYGIIIQSDDNIEPYCNDMKICKGSDCVFYGICEWTQDQQVQECNKYSEDLSLKEAYHEIWKQRNEDTVCES